jgi:RNA polymerase sigma factor (sigma-70 family)
LVLYYWPRLYAYAKRAVRDHDLACDLAQETLLRYLLKDRYPPNALWTILVNLIKDLVRERMRYVNGGMNMKEIIESLPDREPDPLDRAVVKDEYERVIEAMKRHLPEDTVQILLRRYYDDRPIQEIADDLNIENGAARTRLTRAVQKVRARTVDS